MTDVFRTSSSKRLLTNHMLRTRRSQQGVHQYIVERRNRHVRAPARCRTGRSKHGATEHNVYNVQLETFTCKQWLTRCSKHYDYEHTRQLPFVKTGRLLREPAGRNTCVCVFYCGMGSVAVRPSRLRTLRNTKCMLFAILNVCCPLCTIARAEAVSKL